VNFFSNVFPKSVENIKVLLQSDKNNGYFTWRQIYIFDHISWREMFQTKVLKKIKIHIYTFCVQ